MAAPQIVPDPLAGTKRVLDEARARTEGERTTLARLGFWEKAGIGALIAAATTFLGTATVVLVDFVVPMVDAMTRRADAQTRELGDPPAVEFVGSPAVNVDTVAGRVRLKWPAAKHEGELLSAMVLFKHQSSGREVWSSLVNLATADGMTTADVPLAALPDFPGGSEVYWFRLLYRTAGGSTESRWYSWRS